MLDNEGAKGIDKINLNELNACVEENRRNMDPSIDYDFLEKSARIILQRLKMENGKHIVPVILFNREEGISIVLKFFDSLNNNVWYSRAKDILLGQDKNIGINIFDSEDIDFSEKDENGFDKYSNYSSLQYKAMGPKALVKILLKEEFEDVSKVIEENKLTLEDLYSIVHEISHTFDLGETEKCRRERNLFAEVPPYCFERMFGDYLVHNNIISESVMDKIIQTRYECSVRHARAVCTKINLVRLKEKDGRIDRENIKNMLEENDIRNPFYVQSMLRDVLTANPSIDFQARYGIAELTAHQYMKLYEKDKKEAIVRLEKYCEELKMGNSNDEVLKLVGCPTSIKEVEEVANDISCSRNR